MSTFQTLPIETWFSSSISVLFMHSSPLKHPVDRATNNFLDTGIYTFAKVGRFQQILYLTLKLFSIVHSELPYWPLHLALRCLDLELFLFNKFQPHPVDRVHLDLSSEASELMIWDRPSSIGYFPKKCPVKSVRLFHVERVLIQFESLLKLCIDSKPIPK